MSRPHDRQLSSYWPILTLVLAGFLGTAFPSHGTTVVLNAAKDNTLFEDLEGDLSNGQGVFLYAGLTGEMNGFNLRRALISFDLSAIPAGATINDVSLSLYMSKSSPNPDPVNISLHLATSNWGEGASNAGNPGGGGAPAQAGDATWLFNFFGTSSWKQTGGDFSPDASATTTVDIVNRRYNWSSSALISEVQGWLNNPATNFGWFILGNETATASAQRFNSSEATSNVPQLTVTYTIPEPSALIGCAVGAFGFAARRPLRRTKSTVH